MPLSFGALLGGMATLFTTANLLVSASLADHGYRGFGVLDFLPAGLPMAAAGILFVALVGRRLLPSRQLGGQDAPPRPTGTLADAYGMSKAVSACYVKPGSAMAGLSVAEGQWGERLSLNVLGIAARRRGGPGAGARRGSAGRRRGPVHRHHRRERPGALWAGADGRAGVDRQPGVRPGEPGGGDALAALGVRRQDPARAALPRQVRPVGAGHLARRQDAARRAGRYPAAIWRCAAAARAAVEDRAAARRAGPAGAGRRYRPVRAAAAGVGGHRADHGRVWAGGLQRAAHRRVGLCRGGADDR